MMKHDQICATTIGMDLNEHAKMCEILENHQMHECWHLSWTVCDLLRDLIMQRHSWERMRVSTSVAGECNKSEWVLGIVAVCHQQALTFIAVLLEPKSGQNQQA
jgi:hypothetical protein